jgi:hypothetical protein
MQDDRKRLVVTEGRCERVYKRTGEPSVTFCGKEPQRNKAPRWLICETKKPPQAK